MEKVKIRVKSKDEQWKEGISAIDRNIEAMRDNLHDKGWVDEEEIQSALNGERAEMMDELSRNIEGDYSNSYEFKKWADLNNIEYPDEIISPVEREESANDLINDSLAEDNNEQEEQANDLIEDASVEDFSAVQTFDQEQPSDLIDVESENTSDSMEGNNEEDVSYSY